MEKQDTEFYDVLLFEGRLSEGAVQKVRSKLKSKNSL